jgi:hypothetical protein
MIYLLCIDICKLMQFLKHSTCQYVASTWGLLSRVRNNTEANRGCTEVCRGVPNRTEMGRVDRSLLGYRVSVFYVPPSG